VSRPSSCPGACPGSAPRTPGVLDRQRTWQLCPQATADRSARRRRRAGDGDARGTATRHTLSACPAAPPSPRPPSPRTPVGRRHSLWCRRRSEQPASGPGGCWSLPPRWWPRPICWASCPRRSSRSSWRTCSRRCSARSTPGCGPAPADPGWRRASRCWPRSPCWGCCCSWWPVRSPGV
jgi:hypothetical protein